MYEVPGTSRGPYAPPTQPTAPQYVQVPPYQGVVQYQHPQYSPVPQYAPYGPPGVQPGRGKAIASLVLGIVAMTVPIPILDIIAGIVGLVLYSSARREGYSGGLATAGLICSVLGTVWATIFTVSVFTLGLDYFIHF